MVKTLLAKAKMRGSIPPAAVLFIPRAKPMDRRRFLSESLAGACALATGIALPAKEVAHAWQEVPDVELQNVPIFQGGSYSWPSGRSDVFDHARLIDVADKANRREAELGQFVPLVRAFKEDPPLCVGRATNFHVESVYVRVWHYQPDDVKAKEAALTAAIHYGQMLYTGLCVSEGCVKVSAWFLCAGLSVCARYASRCARGHLAPSIYASDNTLESISIEEPKRPS